MKNSISQFCFGKNDIRALPIVQKKFVDGFSTVELLNEAQNDEEKNKVAFDPTNQQIIWGIDPNEDGAVIPTWMEFFLRRNAGVAKAKLWLEKIHPDDRENAVQIFCEAVVKKDPFAVEFRLQKEEKSYLRLLVCGFPVLENDGSILHWIGTSSMLS